MIDNYHRTPAAHRQVGARAVGSFAALALAFASVPAAHAEEDAGGSLVAGADAGEVLVMGERDAGGNSATGGAPDAAPAQVEGAGTEPAEVEGAGTEPADVENASGALAAGDGAADALATGSVSDSSTIVDISTDEWYAVDAYGQKVDGSVRFATGEPLHPIAAVTNGTDQLREGTFKIRYVNDKVVPPGVDGKGNPHSIKTVAIVYGQESENVIGSFAVTFKVRRYNLASDGDVVIGAIGKQTIAAGQAACPKPEVVASDGTVLTEGVDYELSYRGNDKPGTGTVVVKALDAQESRCAGSRSLQFEVAGETVEPEPVDISSAAKVDAIPAQEYTGAALEPPVSVHVSGKKLVQGSDFKAVYSGNVNAGKAKVVLEGLGAYRGRYSTSFEIRPVDLSKVDIAPLDEVQYSGSAVEPSLDGKLTYNGRTLGKKSYTVSYDGNAGVGTGRVTVSGKGNFAGKRTIEFRISAQSIANASCTAKSVYTDGLVDGKNGSPSRLSIPVTVKVGKTKLKENRDYTVSFAVKKKGKLVAIKAKKLKQPGTYYAVVKGKGNYQGTKWAQFKLVNIGDDLARYACGMSYSRHVTWQQGYKGTKAYKKSGARRGCHSAMYGAYKGSGYWKAFKPNNYDAASAYKKSKSRWRCIGRFVPGSRTTSTGVKMLPGDTLCGCRGGGYHTCMYVGKSIPKEVYKSKLKGKGKSGGDLGNPSSGIDFVSASYHEVSAACYCNAKNSFANHYGSNMKVYRLIKPDKKKYRVGAVVR